MTTEDQYPIGTPVVVFRVDGNTFVGNGVIENWVLFSEIPEEDTEVLAPTGPIGNQELCDPEDVMVVLEDDTVLPLSEALEELETLIPAIRLENGDITYGPMCYWRPLKQYEEPKNN